MSAAVFVQFEQVATTHSYMQVQATHTYIYTYTHTQTHTHIHFYTHFHTQAQHNLQPSFVAELLVGLEKLSCPGKGLLSWKRKPAFLEKEANWVAKAWKSYAGA